MTSTCSYELLIPQSGFQANERTTITDQSEQTKKTKTRNDIKHNTIFLSCLHLKADYGQIKQQQQQQRTDKSQQTKKQKERKNIKHNTLFTG